MQSFKNAKFGINHIYAAIILSFIASTVDVIASIFNLKSLDMTLSINMLISTVVTLFTALFPLLSSVLMITGLKVAGKDSKKLKTAFYFSIISIVLTTADFVISTMISYNIVGSPEIAGFILLFVDTGKSIMSILISVMICSGYSDLLK